MTSQTPEECRHCKVAEAQGVTHIHPEEQAYSRGYEQGKFDSEMDRLNITPDITNEELYKKIDDYYREQFDDSQLVKKLYITELIHYQLQKAREEAFNEIIKMAETCTDCGKPKHIHPHDFYDNALDCNCHHELDQDKK